MAKPIIKGETLKLEFVVPAESINVIIAGPTKVSGNATQINSSTWRYTYDTSGMPSGLYSWEAFAVKEGITTHIERSNFELKESLASAPSESYDAINDKSHASTMVDLIEQMLRGNASAGVRSYQINNRRLDRYSIDELLKLLNYYKMQVATEDRKKRNGRVLGSDIQFRL